MAHKNLHNKILMKKSDEKENLVIADQKQTAPPKNKCCLKNVIYQAKVSKSKDDYKIYTGSKKRSFESRYIFIC